MQVNSYIIYTMRILGAKAMYKKYHIVILLNTAEIVIIERISEIIVNFYIKFDFLKENIPNINIKIIQE